MQKQNLTELVFEELKTEIMNGKYAFEENLPPLLQLCEQYQIGRNTARSVLLKLEEEQLISIHKGRSAKVIFNIGNEEDYQLFLKKMLGKSAYYPAVFETMRLLLPEFAVENLKAASPTDFNRLKGKIRLIKEKTFTSDQDLLNILMEIYDDAFMIKGNGLMGSLFDALMQFIYMGVPDTVLNKERFEKTIVYTKKMISSILEFVLLGNTKLMKKSIQILISFIEKSNQDILKKYEHSQVETKMIPFQWKSNRYKDTLYTRVIADIIRKIKEQVYEDADSLPSFENMAKDYDVSVKTCRKAIEILNTHHIVKTVNGVGSFISLTYFQQHEQQLLDQTLQEHILEYYQALDVMRVCIKGIGKTFFDTVEKEQMDQIIETLQDASFFTLKPIIQEMFQINACLASIYEELSSCMPWSFYIDRLGSSPLYEKDSQSLQQELVQALSDGAYKKSLHLINQVLDEVVSTIEKRKLVQNI